MVTLRALAHLNAGNHLDAVGASTGVNGDSRKSSPKEALQILEAFQM
jgi:hypothetical protein